MPIVTVQQGPRDIELVRELVRRVTGVFVDSLRIPAGAVQVRIPGGPDRQLGRRRQTHRRHVAGHGPAAGGDFCGGPVLCARVSSLSAVSGRENSPQGSSPARRAATTASRRVCAPSFRMADRR